MLARILHILCSLWLVVLLLFGTTPAAAIHAFAHHHDTVHHRSREKHNIEPRHHHCQFLSFHLMPFDAPPQWHARPAQKLQKLHSFYIIRDERAAQQILALREGRGPPHIS